MEIRVVHINRPEDEQDDDRRERIRTRRDIQTILEQIMALSAQVAAALEQARKLDNVVDAVNKWGEGLQAQIADLKDQIVNNTPSLSEEDKQALAEITKELQENVARMPGQVVENTPQEGTGTQPAPETGPQPQPVANDPAPPENVAQPDQPAPETQPAPAADQSQPQG